MKPIFTLSFVYLFFTTGLFAQTSDVVVFSDAGEKFTLVIDGDVKNATPATRVVATGIKNETPLLLVKFEDATIPPVKQNGWMEHGSEYTLRITTNKKGNHVLRMQGQAPLGSAAKATEKPVPAEFVEDPPAPASTGEVIATDYPTTVKSTTTVTTTNGTTGQDVNMGTDGVSMSIGVNGTGMNVNVHDATGGTSTTTTTTTTTTHTQSTTEVIEVPTEPVEETSGTGCVQAMNGADFQDAVASVKGKGFDDTKLTLAKQIGSSNCLSTAQVKTIMGLFGFEDSKLDFAKFAYDHVIDMNNYYKVNDAFSFSSSVDELNSYIQGR